jgi:transmembrane sensor
VVQRTAENTRLKLDAGRVVFDVTRDPGRDFVVAAGGVEVRVIGTRFSVERRSLAGQERVRVSVERGVVEVMLAPGAAPIRLLAGQSWSQDGIATAEVEASADPGAAPESPISTPDESTAKGNTKSDPRASASSKAAEVPAEREPSPGEALWREAQAARRGGDVAAAARAYESLMNDHPQDGYAGLAAFELGRLRMDTLGDTGGAVVALRRAIALAPGSSFREDAMARLVRAYSGLASRDACLKAKQAYEREYPGGVHRRGLSTACR